MKSCAFTIFITTCEKLKCLVLHFLALPDAHSDFYTGAKVVSAHDGLPPSGHCVGSAGGSAIFLPPLPQARLPHGLR